MIAEYFNQLMTVGLTALFNPGFLFLLVILFFLGRLVGWMTRTVNIWKFLALAYFGVFLFRPLQELGLVIGGIFILGVASMYLDLFREIFSWAGSYRDVLSAFRYRGVYADIRRLEEEIAALKQQLHAAQSGTDGDGGSARQNAWRAQSQARKAKSKPKSRGSGGQNGTGTGSQNNRSQQGSSFAQGGSSGSGRSRSKTNKSTAGSGSQRRGSSTSRGTGSANSTGSQKNTQSSQGARSSWQNTGQSSRSSGQNRSQSQNTGSSRNTGSGAPMSDALRNKYLQTLELTPGRSYTPQELKAAWRKMAFKTHPDRGGTAAAFAQVRAAYKALT